jgi:serine/threonine-protein phosphatase 6 regulatory subunit 3
MDDVMLCEAKLGEVKEIDNSSGSSAPETTVEAVLPVSSDFDSIKHPEPVGETTVSEHPLGGQNKEEDEHKRE